VTTVDNIGSGGATNDGTIVSTVTVNQPSFLNGGTSYDFGGGRVTAAAFPTQTEWTLEAWINWDGAKIQQCNIFGQDQPGWNDDVLFGIAPEQGGQPFPVNNFGIVQQGAPGATRDWANAPVTANEWHHVAATGSTTDGELKFYGDGVLVDTDDSFINGITMNGHQFAVGDNRFEGIYSFDGLIDEFAIYDKVLDAATIASHFQIGSSETVDPFELIITSITSLGSGNFELTLKGEPSTSYEFRSSPTLDFTPGDLVAPLTVTLGTGGGLDVTTDVSGDATVQMSLGAVPANFVRAVGP
jgi:hypothetical protein